MGRGFRELGEPARDGDLFDQLRADTEAAELAAENNPANNPAADLASFEGPKQDTRPRTGWSDPATVACPDDQPAEGIEGLLQAGGCVEGIDYVLMPSDGEQGPQFAPWRTPAGPDGPLLITLPGVYDLDAQEYHDPAVTGDWLSNSDARQLIAPGCPAQFRYDRDNGVRKTSAAFSMGHAVHARILGKGETIAVRPAEFDSWRTKASQAWRAEQERAGRSVILPEDAETVEAMAMAVHEKQRAHELLSQPGRPEVALFWVDPETGVRRRALVDYLPSVVDEYGVMSPVDIKSADSVSPDDDMERKLYHHAWHRQATTIADGIRVLGLAQEVEFYFIVQSKTPPHLVTVVKLDADAERIGRIENREAIWVYKRCLDTGVWPDYAEDSVTLTVPAWIARQYEEDIR